MKVALKAYCSGNCDEQNRTGRSTRGTMKDVSFGKSNCPDCGYALVWKKENTRKFNYVDRRKTQVSDLKRTFIE